jgi:hypothetical protein
MEVRHGQCCLYPQWRGPVHAPMCWHIAYKSRTEVKESVSADSSLSQFTKPKEHPARQQRVHDLLEPVKD